LIIKIARFLSISALVVIAPVVALAHSGTNRDSTEISVRMLPTPAGCVVSRRMSSMNAVAHGSNEFRSDNRIGVWSKALKQFLFNSPTIPS
jgi:hypothetical protein